MRHFIFAATLVLVAIVGGAQAQDEPVIYYLALGDSVAAGYSNDGLSYVGFYVAQFEAASGQRVELIDKTRNGWSSRLLLNALRNQDTFKTSLQNADMVTWNIVGNDFIQARFRYLDGNCGGFDNQDCLRSAEAEAKANWVAILEEILSVRSTDRHLIRTMDIYNPFVREDVVGDSWPNDGNCHDLNADGACSDFEVFLPYANRINTFLAASAAEFGVPLAKVSEVFNGQDGRADPRAAGWIGSDGIHPNNVGHELLAQLLSDLEYSPVWPPSQAYVDSDGDGVPDNDDLCPTFPGSPATDGC